jgi:hypothetical protein
MFFLGMKLSPNPNQNIAFSQFMLIWYANLPEETVYYVHRVEHGWQPVSLALVGVRFALPFLLLLPRRAKSRPALLVPAGLLVLAGQWLDLYWLIMPWAFHGGPVFGWQEVGPVLLRGACWQEDHTPRGDRLVHLLPCKAIVAVFRGVRHGSTPLSSTAGDPTKSIQHLLPRGGACGADLLDRDAGYGRRLGDEEVRFPLDGESALRDDEHADGFSYGNLRESVGSSLWELMSLGRQVLRPSVPWMMALKSCLRGSA